MWLGQTGFDAPRTNWHKNQYGWHVHQEFTFANVLSICGLFIGTYSPEILPDLLVPGWNILWCQYGYCDMCPYIIYNSDHCGSSKSVCTIVGRLCWKTLGRDPMAWLVQSIIAFWIVEGCYRRYVDKIGSNTILLLSSIPCHWIGTMRHCHKLAPSDLGSQGHLWSENDAITSGSRLISTLDHEDPQFPDMRTSTHPSLVAARLP